MVRSESRAEKETNLCHLGLDSLGHEGLHSGFRMIGILEIHKTVTCQKADSEFSSVS